MPVKGYKSITVPDDIYDYFKKKWEERKTELRLKGIRSFSAFVTKYLNDALEQETQHTPK